MYVRKSALVVHKDNVDKLYAYHNKEIDPSMLGMMDRNLCETDENYRQLIPYVVLMYVNKEDKAEFFTYIRGKQGDEGRLHNFASIGIGGHIDIALETEGKNNFAELIMLEAQREVTEEVGINSLNKNSYLKQYYVFEELIKSDLTAVDRVHLGIPIMYEVTNKNLPALEEGVITNAQWLTAAELVEQDKNGTITLENWTKIFLENFFY